jgi:hypothetical protein
MASQAVTLIREHYADFAPTVAAEYLDEHHGITLSKETVRRLMIEARLWRARRGPSARLHPQRERRERFGELIQIDSSYHAWFEARGEPCCLLVFIDDATSRLTQCRFLPHETTFGYMQTLYEHIGQHGLPMALYSDRHSIFSVNSPKAKASSLSHGLRPQVRLRTQSWTFSNSEARGEMRAYLKRPKALTAMTRYRYPKRIGKLARAGVYVTDARTSARSSQLSQAIRASGMRRG